MLELQVRVAALTGCGHDLSAGSRRVGEAAATFDQRATVGADLPHPVAAEAYERFFAAWSLRLQECVAALDAGAGTVLSAARSYAQWERFVADLSR